MSTIPLSKRHDATVSPAEAVLLRKAQAVAANAYAPYSQFAVGAAVETTDGQVFLGANMENASNGLTACAELGALQAATSAGVLQLVRRIAIVGGPIKSDALRVSKPTAPCGRCRQLIHEAAVLGRRDVEVLFADSDLKTVRRRAISELLPDSFDAGNLS
jgi:cytidine deaminase